ncbi:hypothetical protein TrRE_jg5195, partial [Triparma retinervis]
MLFSKPILKRVFTGTQIAAAAVCITGIGLVILSDALFPTGDKETTEGVNDSVTGDLLALIGSIVYALNNVLCEKYVQVDRIEYLGMLGLFATIWAGMEVAALESGEVGAFFTRGSEPECEGGSPGWLLGGYVISITLFYVRMTSFVQTSSAALLNVSLLTSDVYSLVWVVATSGHWPSWVYFVGTAFIFGGVGLYSYAEDAVEEEKERGSTVEEDGGDRREDRLKSDEELLGDKDRNRANY